MEQKELLANIAELETRVKTLEYYIKQLVELNKFKTPNPKDIAVLDKNNYDDAKSKYR